MEDHTAHFIISFSVHLDLADGDGDSIPKALAKLAGWTVVWEAIEAALRKLPGVDWAEVRSVAVTEES